MKYQNKYKEIKKIIDHINENRLLTWTLKSRDDKEIIRILWTAFCINHDWEVDTKDYDDALQEIYNDAVKDKREAWKSFDAFDKFMCKYLV